MKKNIWTVMSLILLTFAAANAQMQSGDRSKQIQQDRVERESTRAAQDPNARPVSEALSAVEETRSAVQFLDQKNPSQAKAALTRALGKTDMVLATHPKLALVPVALDMQIVDTKADDATLKLITNQIRDLVKEGRFQAARPLLRDLASEIDVTSVNLPIATYPASIKSAAVMIDQGKTAEAKVQLLATLHSLVVAERVIPLPVVRAQALVDEVNQQVTAKKIDKNQANQFLDEANQQLAFAEKLGYGTGRKDFAELQASIQMVKRNINRDQESKGMIAKIMNGLENLKQKIWGSPTASA